MDGRVFQKNKDDVHHQAGMECIDCHVSQEIMGDGNFYEHMEEQVRIQCEDCHSKETHSISYDELDFESKKIVDLRNLKIRGYEIFTYWKIKHSNSKRIRKFIWRKISGYKIKKRKTPIKITC